MQTIYKITKAIREKVAKLNEKGQGMVEYAIILAVVAAVAIFVFGTGSDSDESGLGVTVKKAFDKASTQIDKAGVTGTDTDGGGGGGGTN